MKRTSLAVTFIFALLVSTIVGVHFGSAQSPTSSPIPIPSPIFSSNGEDTTVTIFQLSSGCFISTGTASDADLIMFMQGVKIVSYYSFDTSAIPSNAITRSITLKVKPEAVNTPTYVTAYAFPRAIYDWDSYSQSAQNPADCVYISTIGQSYSFNIPVSDLSHGNNTIVLESSINGRDLAEEGIVLNNNAQLVTNYSVSNTSPSPTASPTQSPSPTATPTLTPTSTPITQSTPTPTPTVTPVNSAPSSLLLITTIALVVIAFLLVIIISLLLYMKKRKIA